MTGGDSSTTRWALLACAILSEVAGSLTLKAALGQPALYAVVLVGYVASFVFLAAALKRGMALGVAYGIWGALGVALTAVLGAVLFAEPLNGVMAAGIVLIIGGVLVVELGAQRAKAAEPEAGGAEA